MIKSILDLLTIILKFLASTILNSIRRHGTLFSSNKKLIEIMELYLKHIKSFIDSVLLILMMIFLDQNSLSCFKVNLILIAKRKIHVISVMIIRSLIKNVCKSYICAHQVLILTYYSKISKLKQVSQLMYINRKNINFLRKL